MYPIEVTEEEEDDYNEGFAQFAQEYQEKYEAEHPDEMAGLRDDRSQDFADNWKDWKEEFQLRYGDEMRQLWNEEWEERK
jgi:uncharacterized protein YeaO (DUF488 family)